MYVFADEVLFEYDMENTSQTADPLGCFPSESPVQHIGRVPSACHSED